jgi:hypothetical protein
MSLVQHVHPLEGSDREEALVDLFLPPLERHLSIERSSQRRLSFESGYGGGPHRSLRHVISYDALKPVEETTEEYGGVTQYRVSTAKRVGKLTGSGSIRANPLTLTYSPGRYHSPRMLVCKWNRFWLCCAEANPHKRRRI